ncbi:cellulose synthase [Rhizobium sp. CG5]|uniref:tetratricopeptide repeat protein n=1 Tax=Rhizobium sp. CG5 TaxID=2726076 RepID=UPI0020344B8C|nr:cellulose synthase [Rhizobium sp. CG5]MCM2474422.1 cellulose synthase [Rhizobium sp. CG5]
MKSSVITFSAVLLSTIGAVAVDMSRDVQTTLESIVSWSGQPQDVKTARAPQMIAQAPIDAPVAAPRPETAQTRVEEPATKAAPEIAVDESALRYFASRGDTARLQAEIARLRALYPNWTPPQDPLAIPQNADAQLEEMWQLYAGARYADVRKAIEQRQKREPTWQVPADLLDRLTVAEERLKLVSASDLKQYDTVVEIGSRTPSLLTCSDVDSLWRVAEAFFFTKRQQRAQDAFGYVLNNCENVAERLATMQKAAAILPTEAVESLMAKERKLPDGTMEFESMRDDLARRFVADAGIDATKAVPQSYLMRLERIAETGGLASDALLLGWYHYRQKEMTIAEQWFRRAMAKEDTASAAQGLALTQLDRQDPLSAEDTMYRWRDASKDANAVYLAAAANTLALDPPVAIKPEVLARMAQEAIESRDPATAQEFGWYARTLNQPETAIQWFKTALAWKPDDEPSAYGLAVTYQQAEYLQDLAQIQQQWQGRSDRIARVGDDSEQPDDRGKIVPGPGALRPDDRSVEGQQVLRAPAKPIRSASVEMQSPRSADRAGKSGSERGALVARPSRPPVQTSDAGCKTTINARSLAPQVALSRGWCLMDRNRPLEAAAAFEVALTDGSAAARQDAAYGQSLAYLRAGLTNKAAVAASKAPQSQGRSVELQRAILADKAIAAFDGGRPREAILVLDQLKQFGPERADLLVLKGYAYLQLKRYGDARRIFQALDAVGNREAARGLATINDILRQGGG